MIDRKRAPFVAALATLLLTPVALANDRPTLVVWLDPTPPRGSSLNPTDELRRQLDARAFTLAPATWTGPGFALHFADPRSPRTDVQLFDTLSTLRNLPGVAGAGELLVDRSDRVRFWSGRLAIRFRRPTTEAAARAVGDALGLGPPRKTDRRGDLYLFDAELRPSELPGLQSNATLLPSVDWLRPVDYVAYDPMKLRPRSAGRYHRIPRRRNKITLLLKSSAVSSDVQDVINAHNGTIDDIGTVGDRWINVSFRADPPPPSKTDEQEMEDALQDLLRLEDDVIHAGPAVLGGPPGFLTDQLVVRFASEMDRFQAAPILENFGSNGSGFVEVRRLPYIVNGYLFRFMGGPSYRIYDAARELILQERADYAVPNLMTVNSSACVDDCFAADHQAYLDTMHVCEPRTEMPAQAKDWTVRLAVLDEGANGVGGKIPTACERLYVDTVIDFESMQACTPDPTNWCSDCGDIVDPWTAGHGNGVSLIAGATRDGSDTDLVGVAPGVKMINARRPTQDEGLMTDVAFSDALWWLAGGDPEWCCDASNYLCSAPAGCVDPCAASPGETACLPDPLSSEQRADVINLSFTREDFLGELADCSNDECSIVCASASTCAVIQETLEAIRCPDCGHGMRPGGAVAVAAVGNDINEDKCNVATPHCYPAGATPDPNCFRTDLAELESTVAVGSVESTEEGWKPFYEVSGIYCLIHNQGSFVDLVGPFGQSNGTTLCKNCGRDGKEIYFGASSGATGAVSGIAATMLQLNSDLTAEQVHCILRETAEPDLWSDTSGWPIEIPVDCELTNVGGKLHGSCLGRGMADACAAAEAAVACKDPTSAGCPTDCAVESLTAAESASDEDEGNDEDDEDVAVCESDKKTKPGRSLKIGKVIHPLEGRELPPALRDLLRCLGDRSCYCETMPGCPELELVNRQKKTLFDQQARLCFGERCWPMPGTIDKWKPGEKIRIPLEAEPEMAGYIGLGLPATIEIVPAGKGKGAKRND